MRYASKHTRKNSPLFTLRRSILLGLLASPLGWGQGSNEGTESLRSTVAQWVTVMQKIQEEQARWTREKQILEDLWATGRAPWKMDAQPMAEFTQ